ncbi:MAG TPA: pyridoxal-phosphate dependent enzyme [Acidimicrobiia bacterium]|nr:pyridoxal-phosphate dependent enzyme [Acidimicrobiia bacterium]
MAEDRPTGWGGDPVQPPSLDEVREAAERIAGTAVRTPLMGLHGQDSEPDIFLKPEMLQPVGSFKIRGVGNWALSLDEEEARAGIATTSAGNTAMALGYMGKVLGVPARSHVPDSLHESKRAAIAAYGVDLIHVSMTDLMRFMFEEAWRQEPYTYLNPWGEPLMIAGHGTIGLEIFEDLADLESVFVPVGGGALISGVASALKALKPTVRVYAVQARVNSALAAAFEAGGPTWIEWHDTIVEGASTPVITDEMYPMLRSLIDQVVLVSEEQVMAAMSRLAMQDKLVTEGAGAASVAAALATPVGERGLSVCVVSGGSVDRDLLARVIGEAAW